jgi:hypothetical protein
MLRGAAPAGAGGHAALHEIPAVAAMASDHAGRVTRRAFCTHPTRPIQKKGLMF